MPREIPPIPPKPIGTGELARSAGVSLATVRKLERLKLLRAVRDYRGWRAFAPSEVARLRELLGWQVLNAREPESAEPNGNGDGTATEARADAR